MVDEIKNKLFLNQLCKIEENRKFNLKSRFKEQFQLISCIKTSFTIVITFLLLFMVLPQSMGYSLGVIEPRSNSMKDSLGNVGVGYYKNYKSPIYACVGQGDYLSGPDSYVFYNVSEVKNDIKTGDIVIFNRRGIDVIHQVIEKYDYSVITKGTNNIYEDDFLDYDEIKGKLVFWWRIY